MHALTAVATTCQHLHLPLNLHEADRARPAGGSMHTSGGSTKQEPTSKALRLIRHTPGHVTDAISSAQEGATPDSTCHPACTGRDGRGGGGPGEGDAGAGGARARNGGGRPGHRRHGGRRHRVRQHQHRRNRYRTSPPSHFCGLARRPTWAGKLIIVTDVRKYGAVHISNACKRTWLPTACANLRLMHALERLPMVISWLKVHQQRPLRLF